MCRRAVDHDLAQLCIEALNLSKPRDRLTGKRDRKPLVPFSTASAPLAVDFDHEKALAQCPLSSGQR